VDGQLVYGHDGRAGELGHVNVEQNGRICRCGNKGCLEAYVSAKGIKRTFFNLLCSRSEKNDLRQVSFNKLTSKMIYDAARKGDAIALEAFSITGKILGVKLSDVVAITNPETIFIMGGLAQAGDIIFNPTQNFMEKNLFPVFRGKVKILPSKLKEKNAAVLGAGALAWKELNIQ
jgi:glucokinase